MIKIHFPELGQELVFQEGTTLASACEKAGYPLDMVCGGKGTCKKCTLEIERDGRRETVLGCQEKVSPGLKIYLRDKTKQNSASILVSHEKAGIEFLPALQKIYLPRESLRLPFFAGTWEYLAEQTHIKIKTPSLPLLQKLQDQLKDPDLPGLTLVIWKDTLIEVERGNTTEQSYGFAIDLGTTTVVAYLYNMNTGEKIGAYSALNGQISEGADVISRLLAAINDPQGLERLQQKIISTINGLIEQALKQEHISSNNIYTLSICGNSAMQHLFLGLSPHALARTPFSNAILHEVIAGAQDLQLKLHPRAVVQFLPLIGGFVGADTTAVLISLEPEDREDFLMIIDLGTNGEILLGQKDRWLATSTAAGPALEGANIAFGMRAAAGAIEKIRLTNGTVELQVIGKTDPLGICGSGIIDAVAELLKVGIITSSGKLLTKEAYLAECKPEYRGLAENLEIIAGVSCFVLAPGSSDPKKPKVYLTQKDIRSVQLAKSAIYTACTLLHKEYGAPGTAPSRILIAGAFGNYVDVENARYIGLIPTFTGVSVTSIGNAAGAGAERYLLSRPIQDLTSGLVKKIEHLDLSTHPEFQKAFLQNVRLGTR